MQLVQWAPLPFEGHANKYFGQRVQLYCNPHGVTHERMMYEPLETMFPSLDLVILTLGCTLLETMQTLLIYATLEVGREGEFLVAAFEVVDNGAIFHVLQASSCNCGFSGGWVMAEMNSLVKGWSTSRISHSDL